MLQETFLCPSDNIPGNQDLTNWGLLIADANAAPQLNGYTSYFTNSEAFGFCPGTSGNKASIVGHSRAAGFIPAMGSSPTQTMLLSDGLFASPGGGTFEYWSHNSPSTLADVFNGNGGSGSGGFDLLRHRGKINVLFLDGHVESMTITNTGGTTTGAGITASGDLANCYVVSKDFHQ